MLIVVSLSLGTTNFAVCNDAARRAGLSATSERLVLGSIEKYKLERRAKPNV